MKQCSNCGMKMADQEPFCPICGPDTELKGISGEYDRASYPDRPRVISLRIQSLIVYDRTLFYILTILIAAITGGLIFIDLFLNGNPGWSKDTTVIFSFIWTVFILPYAFNKLKGYFYILLFTTALSAFLVYFDLQDGRISWSHIVSAVVLLPSIVNCVIFSVKGS